MSSFSARLPLIACNASRVYALSVKTYQRHRTSSRLPSNYILQNLPMLCALDLSGNNLSRFGTSRCQPQLQERDCPLTLSAEEIVALSSLVHLLSLDFSGNSLPFLDESERLTLLRSLQIRSESRDSGEQRHFRRGHADGRVSLPNCMLSFAICFPQRDRLASYLERHV